MVFALNDQYSFVTTNHTSQSVSHEIRLRVIVCPPENVAGGHRVRGHESATVQESPVDEGRPVLVRPPLDKPVVFLVVHLAEVAEEEGRGRRAWERM